ncbi:MAG TPA: pitrilysin family protein [Candidatus Baltobacteraceae bacterium]|jgi:zinc protease|nr:pitrilysin family protein [Candidatus Baltobacteraceae bacterium]
MIWTCGVAAAASDQNVFRAVLDNGLRVVIVRNTLAPVVTTVVNYEVGSDETPPGFPGMAHAQEHMMFRGSPGLSAGQLANISAAIGGDFNADTQQMLTQYFFTAPAEDLDIALHVEALRMKGILSTEELWGKERGAIEQEVAQDLSNPDYVFYTNLLALVFKGTPYAWDALGSRPSFDKTTGAMLKEFHDTWYVPNNAILVICGDVDPQEAMAKVKKLFGDLPSAKLPERPRFDFQPVNPETIKVDTDSPTGMAVIAFRLPGTDSPDYAALQVMSDVLSSMRGRLYSLVPDGKALSASFSYDTLPQAGVGYAEAGFPEGANAEALVAQMRQIFAEEASDGISDELVQAAKRREVASLEFQKSSVSGLAMEWSQALAGEGRQSPEDDVDGIRKVTTAEVNRVAREFLVADHSIVAILSPRPSGKPISSQGFGGQESFAAGEAQGVQLPEWATRAVERLDMPHSTLHPVVTVLSNGLTVVVQPESVSDAVAVYGRVKSNPDVETAKGKDGVDDMLGRLFSFGTKSLDRLAFQKALDDIAANESAGTDFSLQVLSEDFERGVQLLADNELSPALPEEAFTIIQPELAAAVAGQLNSPSYLEGRAVTKALFPRRDPAQRETTPKTIKGLTLADAQNYFHRTFRPDLTTIVVIGKVEPEQARAVIERYFGGWSAQGPKPDTLWPAVPLNKPSTTQVPDSSRVQDEVVLTETVGLTLSQADRYALELGNHVLGGAFYATRLYHDLREEAGLVYYVSSSYQFGQTRSIYTVNYACDPPNVGKARAIVVSNLKAMQDRDVTPEELRQAKGLLLREIPLSESSVDRVADGWLYRSTHDLPLDEPMLAAKQYFDLTAPEVRAAFLKWVRPSDLVQISLGP